MKEFIFINVFIFNVCLNKDYKNWLNSNERNNTSGVANAAVFKNESRVPSETNYTLIWEVDSYSPIIEYNLLFRRYFVSKARI
jgi:hypothetical protein